MNQKHADYPDAMLDDLSQLLLEFFRPCTCVAALSPRALAAAILGGDEQLFKLEAAGLVVESRAQRRARHERYREAVLKLSEIRLIVSRAAPIPTSPSAPCHPDLCHPMHRSRCAGCTRRRLRHLAGGSFPGARSRTKGPSVRHGA